MRSIGLLALAWLFVVLTALAALEMVTGHLSASPLLP